MEPINEAFSQLIDIANDNGGEVCITKIGSSVNYLYCGDRVNIGADTCSNEVSSRSKG